MLNPIFGLNFECKASVDFFETYFTSMCFHEFFLYFFQIYCPEKTLFTSWIIVRVSSYYHVCYSTSHIQPKLSMRSKINRKWSIFDCFDCFEKSSEDIVRLWIIDERAACILRRFYFFRSHHDILIVLSSHS